MLSVHRGVTPKWVQGHRIPGTSSRHVSSVLPLLRKYSGKASEDSESLPLALVPVNIRRDSQGIIERARGWKAERIKTILANPAVVVKRELEPLNIFIGYEQANKYQMVTPEGSPLGYLVEQEGTFGDNIIRQLAGARRPFNATLLDNQGNALLKISRPFTWWMSRVQVRLAQDIAVGGSSYGETPTDNPSSRSLAFVRDDEGILVGETQQTWHLTRRKYDQYQHAGDGSMMQFAKMDAPLLSWDFDMKGYNDVILGSVSRNFSGIARELFTDTGEYVVRFDGAHRKTIEGEMAAGLHHPRGVQRDDVLKILPGLTYDQRAVMLATAISIDIDYFSRHSHAGPFGGGLGMIPIPIPGFGYPSGAPPAGAGEAPVAGEASPYEAGSSAIDMTENGPTSIGERWGDTSFDSNHQPFGPSEPSDVNSPDTGNSSEGTPDDFFTDPGDDFVDDSAMDFTPDEPFSDGDGDSDFW